MCKTQNFSRYIGYFFSGYLLIQKEYVHVFFTQKCASGHVECSHDNTWNAQSPKNHEFLIKFKTNYPKGVLWISGMQFQQP